MSDPGDEHTDPNLITRLQSLKLAAADEAVRQIMQLEARCAWTANLLERQSQRCAELERDVAQLRNVMPAHITKILYEGSG